jgi:hypothetical protein
MLKSVSMTATNWSSFDTPSPTLSAAHSIRKDTTYTHLNTLSDQVASSGTDTCTSCCPHSPSHWRSLRMVERQSDRIQGSLEVTNM